MTLSTLFVTVFCTVPFHAILPGMLCLATIGTFAQEKGDGLGVILGEPTGVSGKTWISGKHAVDAVVAWSFRSKGSFHLHADYLWHFGDAVSSSERFVLYAGAGARLATFSGTSVGVRIPFGIAWWPRNTPIDLFGEIAPIMDLAPATEVRLNGGIGIRYFFQ